MCVACLRSVEEGSRYTRLVEKRRKRQRTRAEIDVEVAYKIAPWPRPGEQPLKAVAEAKSGKKLGLTRFKSDEPK